MEDDCIPINRRQWQVLLRPCAFGLSLLAILVFTWGLGYRLSEYQTKVQPSSSVNVAKMWTDTRRDEVSLERHSAPVLRLLAVHPAVQACDDARNTPCSILEAPPRPLQRFQSFQNSDLSRGPPSYPLA